MTSWYLTFNLPNQHEIEPYSLFFFHFSNKPSNYHNQNNSYNTNYQQQQYYQQPYNNYYPQWGYDQYSSYNYGYNPYATPPPVPQGMMGPPPPMGMPPMPPDMQGSTEVFLIVIHGDK